MSKERFGVQRICFSIREAAESIGVCEDKVRQSVGRDDFPAFRWGGKWMIPVAELEIWASKNARGESYERHC